MYPHGRVRPIPQVGPGVLALGNGHLLAEVLGNPDAEGNGGSGEMDDKEIIGYDVPTKGEAGTLG